MLKVIVSREQACVGTNTATIVLPAPQTSRFNLQHHLEASFRLIIMRIRFRATDFGLVAKIHTTRAKSKKASCAEMVLGSLTVFLL